eukprot:10867642-Heterocapsa_arctica.AAC.1
MANDSRGLKIARDVMAMTTKMVERDAVWHEKYRGAEARPQYNNIRESFLRVRLCGILTAHETVKRQSCKSEPKFGLVGKSTCQ